MIDRLNNVFNLAAQAVRTFKPVRYDPVERKLLTSDKNNDKKFAFITQETVVDYRSVEVSQFYFIFSLSFPSITSLQVLLTGSPYLTYMTLFLRLRLSTDFSCFVHF